MAASFVAQTIVAALPVIAGEPASQQMTLYLTGIDEPSPHLVDDTVPYPSDWSAARWIAHLGWGRGLPVWSENSGRDDAAKLLLSAQRMRENGMFGLMWAFESELYADPNPEAYASIDQYATVVALYTNPYITCLPLILSGP